MKLTEDGMDIDDNNEHPLKQYSPITLTEDGIEYEVLLLFSMYSKTILLSLLNITPDSTSKYLLSSSIMRFVNFEHLPKQYLPMTLTLVGRLIDVNIEHS